MDLSRAAAPEIDRLVLSVNGRMSEMHGDRLMALAADRGLDSLDLLPHFADLLLAGRLSRRLATLRMPYRPPEQVLARIDELEEIRLIEGPEEELVATPRMRELLESLLDARANVAADMWSHNAGEVTAATRHAKRISRAASPDHEVAATHRTLPEPTDPYLGLHHYLTNLRYVRQHDHARAWLSRGLTAPAMLVMTSLWHGQAPEARAEGLDQLIDSGLAHLDPVALTPQGREIRDAIEADTNRRAAVTFGVLDEQASREFIDSLRKLPGSIDPA